MFYSVASPDWKPGQPLTPAGALLFRSRAEAESFAPEATVVGVAVRYDTTTRIVVADSSRSVAARWSAVAVSNKLGGITVFGSVPAALVHDLSEMHQPFAADPSEVAIGGYGWDSLTMALMA